MRRRSGCDARSPLLSLSVADYRSRERGREAIFSCSSRCQLRRGWSPSRKRGAGAGAAGLVAGVVEPAAVEREAAAADTAVEQVAGAFEHRDPLLQGAANAVADRLPAAAAARAAAAGSQARRRSRRATGRASARSGRRTATPDRTCERHRQRPRSRRQAYGVAVRLARALAGTGARRRPHYPRRIGRPLYRALHRARGGATPPTISPRASPSTTSASRSTIWRRSRPRSSPRGCGRLGTTTTTRAAGFYFLDPDGIEYEVVSYV